MRWAIILHGGAKTIAPAEERANRAGCLAALEAGAAVLRRGGTAVEAVEAALRVLEDDPTFNAGRGSVPNADGEVEMDAAVMDGATLELGAVAAIRGVRHPVTVARLMLREAPTLLVAEGARRFAHERGAEFCDRPPPAAAATSPAPRGTQAASVAGSSHDTVGCVALDMGGNLAAATSTGGLPGCPPGRVGDSPLPGCGLYADNTLGAAALSGDGEQIARTLLAARAMQALEAGMGPQAAAEAAIAHLARVGGEAGCILLDRVGRVGWAHNSPHFAMAHACDGQASARVWLKRSEESDAGRDG